MVRRRNPLSQLQIKMAKGSPTECGERSRCERNRKLPGDTNHAERRSCLYRRPPCKDDKSEHKHKFTHPGTYVLSTQRKDKHGHRNLTQTTTVDVELKCAHKHIHTRLGSLTMKRVWNESRASCAVGRLLTHAWTPASGHGPSLSRSTQHARSVENN